MLMRMMSQRSCGRLRAEAENDYQQPAYQVLLGVQLYTTIIFFICCDQHVLVLRWRFREWGVGSFGT